VGAREAAAASDPPRNPERFRSRGLLRQRLTSPVVDQAGIFPDLANPTFQDNTDQTSHRFTA